MVAEILGFLNSRHSSVVIIVKSYFLYKITLSLVPCSSTSVKRYI